MDTRSTPIGRLVNTLPLHARPRVLLFTSRFSCLANRGHNTSSLQLLCLCAHRYPAQWAAAAASTTTNQSTSTRSSSSANTTSNGVTWTVLGDRADIYLMPAKTNAAGLSSLWDLTGRPAIPPRYAFGFLACRWGWKDRQCVWRAHCHLRSLACSYRTRTRAQSSLFSRCNSALSGIIRFQELCSDSVL
jgi:hypothetical protein